MPREFIFIASVLITAGKPDLNLPQVVRDHPATQISIRGKMVRAKFWLNGENHRLIAKYIGSNNGKAVVYGLATKKIATGLAHLGADVKRGRNMTAGEITWVLARPGIVEWSGVPLPPIIYCGQNPRALASEEFQIG